MQSTAIVDPNGDETKAVGVGRKATIVFGVTENSGADEGHAVIVVVVVVVTCNTFCII